MTNLCSLLGEDVFNETYSPPTLVVFHHVSYMISTRIVILANGHGIVSEVDIAVITEEC
jgi:hypothetical protein